VFNILHVKPGPPRDMIEDLENTILKRESTTTTTTTTTKNA
jgi:hypothetical protein